VAGASVVGASVVGVAVVGCLLMHERSHHLPLVPVYRVVYEPLRAYLLYTCVYMAVRGVRAGWNKLARTGAVDARVIRAITPQPLAAGVERSRP
jgi:biofilm PGA synthesis N-glycosyltransferase PgaC